ncbi:MAG: hypothetical protein IT211_13435 [Armatimonadetes bacterium]|nr:hypothetical protein [Armatimonadota bacterium]
MNLPDNYRRHYQRHAATIAERLQQFQNVPANQYLIELCFCLLTPQSKAENAQKVMARLVALGFPETPIDPTPILRDPANYIRFHNQKGERLRAVATRQTEITDLLASNQPTAAKRQWLVEHVQGLGWKEASHVLRNIGHLDLAIIDRHILKHMLHFGAIAQLPASIGTRRTYLQLEQAFFRLAESFSLKPQELDLLFWSLEEGSVRK